MVGKNNDITDHVYDAASPAVPSRLEEGGQGSRTSGMGMFKAPKGRISWVTYVFTIVQVAVFIAEIVKNGMHSLHMADNC